MTYRNKRNESFKVTAKPSKIKGPNWTPEAIKAFEDLRSAVALGSTTLRFPDFDKPFAVGTDASTWGVGSVLFQPNTPDEGPTPENIITYRSHSLRSYERGYAGSPYKLELLAVFTACIRNMINS